MKKFIDTHIHLDLKQFNQDLQNVLKRGREAGVNKFIIPAVQSNNMKKIIDLANANQDIYFAAGNHPNYLDSFNVNDIKKYSSHEKCIAIGECGLDWFRIPPGANIKDVKFKQIDIFKQQIDLAAGIKKPLILHSRDTDNDMLSTLLSYKDNLPAGVIHCYVGSDKLLKLLDHGYYYGIGGVLTYNSAIDLHRNIKRIPLDRIILETDGPYLTPLAMKHKSNFNEPSFIPFIVKKISDILKIKEEVIYEKCLENTENLFFK